MENITVNKSNTHVKNRAKSEKANAKYNGVKKTDEPSDNHSEDFILTMSRFETYMFVWIQKTISEYKGIRKWR